MKKTLFLAFCCLTLCAFRPFWGFFAHQQINRLAVFTLPPEMIGFYKTHIGDITALSVVPDRRRYAVEDEAPRHYLDVDHYGDSALHRLPRDWAAAVETLGEDTLSAHGVLPWHLVRMYYRLREAFLIRDPAAIIRISAEMGHYIADAHVPLHTTENYNGQLTGQNGIHGLWESRLPELYFERYKFFVGRAQYLEDPTSAAWEVIAGAHAMVSAVLTEEKKLAERFGEKKYSFETRGGTTVKVYAPEYAAAYHDALAGMVETQMRASVRMIGSMWYTAWVEAGQPDLRKMIHYNPSEEELERNREELAKWRTAGKVRDHE
jgi:hypothetical protein